MAVRSKSLALINLAAGDPQPSLYEVPPDHTTIIRSTTIYNAAAGPQSMYLSILRDGVNVLVHKFPDVPSDASVVYEAWTALQAGDQWLVYRADAPIAVSVSGAELEGVAV